MSTQTFYVKFDSTWNSPLAVLSSPDGTSQVDQIIITEETTLNFVAVGDVTFPPVDGKYPLQILVGEKLFGTPIVTSEPSTLSVSVSPPPSTIQSQVFHIAANASGTTGIKGLLSNRMFVTPAADLTPPESVTLQYDTTTGLFNLSEGWFLEPGELIIFLRGESSSPLTYTVEINLVDQGGSALSFSNPPIVWIASPSPSWLSWKWVDLGTSSFLLTNKVDQNFGIAMPFHFVINVDGVQVSSPDPIIMNTTIGDG